MCMTGMDKQFMHARTLPSLWAEREREGGRAGANTAQVVRHAIIDTEGTNNAQRTRKEVKRRRRIFLSRRKKWIKDVLNERKSLYVVLRVLSGEEEDSLFKEAA